jgi:hypothetical protein
MGLKARARARPSGLKLILAMILIRSLGICPDFPGNFG